MAIKRYKIQKGPPQTPQEKQKVRGRQMVDQADKVFLKNARLLLLAAAIVLALSAAITAGQSALGLVLSRSLGVAPWGDAALAVLSRLPGALALALRCLLSPVTLLGFWGLCHKLWRGRPQGLSDLLACCRGGAWPRALAFGTVWTVLLSLPGWAYGGLEALLGSGHDGLLLPVFLASSLLRLWLFLRLAPAPLLHLIGATAQGDTAAQGTPPATAAGQPKATPMAAPAQGLPGTDPASPQRSALGPAAVLRAAWGLTRGQLGGMVRHGLRLALRALPGLVAYAVVYGLVLWYAQGDALRALLLALLPPIPLVLVLPLMVLGTVSYMDTWFPSESQLRKKSAPEADRNA